jgi:hypothetical protein
MIEKRFMSSGTATVHPTRRDQYANDLKDMFDFESFAVAGILPWGRVVLR